MITPPPSASVRSAEELGLGLAGGDARADLGGDGERCRGGGCPHGDQDRAPDDQVLRGEGEVARDRGERGDLAEPPALALAAALDRAEVLAHAGVQVALALAGPAGR